MARTKTKPTAWLQPNTVVVTILIIAALVAAVWFAQYLKAQLTGPDVATYYAPLVRHIAQDGQHCYDVGTDSCEKYAHANKEFTVGYIFRQKPHGLTSTILYGCFNRRNNSSVSDFVTTDPQECAKRDLTPNYFGYLSQEPEFEASVKLLRCANSNQTSFLVTDNMQECENAQYNEVTTLGYAATAGFLPQHRLNELCKEATSANVLSQARQAYCQTAPEDFPKTQCNDGIDNDNNGKTDLSDPGCESSQDETELTATPTPQPPDVSWQNKVNKYDVNGDNHITPLDLLLLVNLNNRLGAHQLSVSKDGSPPPYVDINGDGIFSPVDLNMLMYYYRHR